MALNSCNISCSLPKSSCSLNSSNGEVVLPCHLVKINFSNDGSGTSATSKRSKIKRNKDPTSPYLTGDKVHLLSRITERRVVQKRATDFVSSFPLAVNIYKANSDEFKSLKRGNKKVRKSVLTLPNERIPKPQSCTVSDMNDSEYFNQDDDNRKERSKKRLSIQTNRKSRGRNRDFEFYDRDARYCSQMDIDLDCSSTDMIKHFNGDGKTKIPTKRSCKDQIPEENFNGHDVWTVLRNINRFQFRPSPPMSEDSVATPKRKKGFKRRNSRKDTRLFGTCRTEEFAYISSIEVDSKSPRSYSQASSFDRVTVIDKQDEFSQICKEFERNIIKTRNTTNKMNAIRKHNQGKNKTQRQKPPRTTKKALELKLNNNLAASNYVSEFDIKEASGTRENMLKEGGSNDNKDSLISNVELVNLLNQKTSNSGNKIIDYENLSKNKINSQIDLLNDCTDRFICSGYSDSNKPGIENIIKPYKENNKMLNLPYNENNQQMKGINKVILNKGHELNCVVINKRIESQKRKPRLVTTMPSAAIMPKSTQADIKRKLANLSFPLVILGKDELSSTIQVTEHPLQFNGLDERIWPFMVEWNNENNAQRVGNIIKTCPKIVEFNTKRIKCKVIPVERNMNMLRKNNYDMVVSKTNADKVKKITHRIDSTNKNKAEQNHITAPGENNNKSQQCNKQKPTRLFKDKMLKFLYKKSPVESVIEETHQIRGGDVEKYQDSINTGINVDICKDINKRYTTTSREPAKRRYLSPQNTKSLPVKHPWGKAKWASDFIETVIKKIKNGIYYNQDNKKKCSESTSFSKEASIQSALTTKNAADTSVSDHYKEITLIKRHDALEAILGFDNNLRELEVKSLTRTHIEIKNCMTNVMVQFDVMVPTELDNIAINIKKSFSLIPLDINESETKLFKCKATILNAMLPAELCSILPNILGNIIETDSKLASSLLPVGKTESHLSTISELSNSDNSESSKMLKNAKPNLYMPLEIRHLLQGMFKTNLTLHSKNRVTNKAIEIVSDKCISIIELLPKLPHTFLILCNQAPLELMVFKAIPNRRISLPISTPKEQVVFKKQFPTCMALQPYNAAHHWLTPTFDRFNFMGMFEYMWNYYKSSANNDVRPSTSTHCLEITLDGKVNSITMNMSLKNNHCQENNMALIPINNLKIDSIYECYSKNSNAYGIIPMKNLKQIDKTVHRIEKQVWKNHVSMNNNKIKRKGFVKLYRKCKSTSNISAEKCCTPLSKITNLEDFFRLFGSKKSLSSVFDGCSGERILSSIFEMKTWITEISSRQALLVLLLMNKKSTPNLVRFRPILLQGIAVNRITRANELDMEIEVIERENLNKLSQYEGISYLPASIENQDKLLEELYWIAKTTASDYQRTFDESSERLLKALLAKRKKLNPSYLRVMARYVGLGLLKSPAKS